MPQDKHEIRIGLASCLGYVDGLAFSHRVKMAQFTFQVVCSQTMFAVWEELIFFTTARMIPL